MKIERNGVKIELTTDEIEKAYREQLRHYRLMDAEAQFYAFINYAPDDDAECERNLNAAKEFKKKYGFDFDEVVTESAPHYLLDSFVDFFERKYDCDIGENYLWEGTIEYILNEHLI